MIIFGLFLENPRELQPSTSLCVKEDEYSTRRLPGGPVAAAELDAGRGYGWLRWPG